MKQKLDYHSLRNVLENWPNVPIENFCASGIYDRALQILTELQVNGKFSGLSDLMTVIRHILRNQSLNFRKDADFIVPHNEIWPSKENWSEFGIKSYDKSENSIMIESSPWLPEWMESYDTPIFEDSFEEKVVRKFKQYPIDPFLAEATGFSHYISSGQREAIRSAFLLPQGYSLIVSLPTGSGKSLIAQAPILVRGIEGPLTLCIVPTTALAIDQERQFNDRMMERNPNFKSQIFAWHGGISTDKRNTIISAIMSGRQGILFCSPESITNSLYISLSHAAKNGLIGYFIVDEAHMIRQWGESFRPAYQLIAGVRNQLLLDCKKQKFKTILMSATLTEESIHTIDKLFGPSDTIQMISSVILRPEPQYWIHYASNEKDKEKKVLETLRFAPRPCILYFTTREDTINWHKILKSKGFERIECFHGNTNSGDRERIIKQWNKNELDVICATSAFGVGVDKSDVRTVIHATVPESVDRFYQEVGRGGRDGNSSSSILIYTEKDMRTAESLSRPKLITEDIAYRRWSEMAKNANEIDKIGNLLEIDMDTMARHIREQTDFNIEWNSRTLNLMAKAEIIKLRYREIKANEMDSKQLEKTNGVDNAADDQLSYTKIVVEILQQSHRNEDEFKRVFKHERQRSMHETESEKKLLDKLLSGEYEFSDLLSEVYSVNDQNRVISVIRTCGGCPIDRMNGTNTMDLYTEPIVNGIRTVDTSDISSFQRTYEHIDSNYPVLLKLDENHTKDTVFEIFSDLISKFSIREIAIPDSMRIHPEIFKLHSKAKNGILLIQSIEEEHSGMQTQYQLARATLLPGEVPPRDFIRILERPLHILIVPESVPDPNNELRRYVDIGTNTLTLSQFKAGVQL